MLSKLFQSMESRAAVRVDLDNAIAVDSRNARDLILAEAKAICAAQEKVRQDVLRNYSARSILH